jgi:hypothetical protein
VWYLAGLLACRTVLLGTLLCGVRTDGWHRRRVDRHWRCQQWPTGSRHRYRLKPLRHCRRKHLSRRCRLRCRQIFQVPVEVPTICRPALVGSALRRAVMVSTGKPRSAYCGAQFAVQGCSEGGVYGCLIWKWLCAVGAVDVWSCCERAVSRCRHAFYCRRGRFEGDTSAGCVGNDLAVVFFVLITQAATVCSRGS